MTWDLAFVSFSSKAPMSTKTFDAYAKLVSIYENFLFT